MEIMDVSDYTTKQIIFSSWTDLHSAGQKKPKTNLFKPIRQRIEEMKIQNPKIAHRICKLIPSQCPFARKIQLFGHTLLTIPPLCQLNPFYHELMTLRFRAICYLADECGEDVSAYC